MNRVAIVTGGTSGIGLATAQALRDAGATVYVVSRHPAALEGLHSLVADVSDEALQWLSGDMTDSLNSNIHRALGDSTTVYTKAGWISGEGDLYALNDGGIVASSSGAYVLSVMTDACGRNDLLTELVDVLDSVHSGAMLA